MEVSEIASTAPPIGLAVTATGTAAADAARRTRVRVGRHVGRLLATAVPVTAVLMLEAGHPTGGDVAWGMLIVALLLGAVYAGFASVGSELTALGAEVAVARGAVIGLVGVAALGFAFDGVPLDVFWLAAAVAGVFALVALVERGLAHYAPAIQRVLIVGPIPAVHDLLAEAAGNPSRFRFIGVVHDETDGETGGLPLLGHIGDLAAVVRSERPELVAVAAQRNRPAIFASLLDASASGFRVVELAQFYEHAFGRVPVADLTEAWFMSLLHLYQRPYSRAAKRAFDLAVASAIFLATLPLLPLLAGLIRLTPGPAILRQVRVGENGRPFTMFKFRTMRADAEQAGAVWAATHDPRVTRLGRVMRRVRLDELPQLWNVMRGEMSIVGPRPERPEFLERLEDAVPFWSRRQFVKPGLTGWAQIRRGYTADTRGSTEKLSFDLWYLRHRSLFVDIAICVKTLGILARGGAPTPLPQPGAVGVDDAGTPMVEELALRLRRERPAFPATSTVVGPESPA